MSKCPTWMVILAILALTGCARPAPFILSSDPVERAATCGAISWTEGAESEGAGPPNPASVLRVIHFALLGSDRDDTYDADRARAIGHRIIALHNAGTQFPLAAKQACDRAFPASTITKPVLPSLPPRRVLDCATLIDYSRARLRSIGMQAMAADLGNLHDSYAALLTPLTKAPFLQGEVGAAWRNVSLAEAARLGQPGAVLDSCRTGLPTALHPADKPPIADARQRLR